MDIGWIAIVLALTGTIWQFLLYRLSGPRLIIRLVPTILTSDGTLVRGPEKGFGDPPAETLIGPWTIDLAEVELTNVGRMPVSVSDIGLTSVARPCLP